MTLNDFDLAIFGGTGDLAMRKLLPAMYMRERARAIPDGARLICIGRNDMTDSEFMVQVIREAKPHIKAPYLDENVWERFARRVRYVGMDATQADSYRSLVAAIRPGTESTNIFYLATPPGLFSLICHNLAESGLASPNSRIVLEKPLGHDLQSARDINAEVAHVFSEEQIFRIDHYLGKETVQNLLALRFGNVLLEPLWRREWISDVQITIAEKLGVGNRLGYYDTSGALRDMLQNHLLQLLCIVAMEPPSSMSSDAVRDEKVKVLRALRRFTPASLAHDVVRGQYRNGYVDGNQVPGYRNETGANPDSHTETYVAVKTEIESWRWAGVPFFLRTGKRMADTLAEVVVRFKDIPHSIFSQHSSSFEANSLLIRLQPDEGLHLNLMAKTPGDGMRLRPIELEMNFQDNLKNPRMEAYERLLMDVLRGQLSLFMRSDELEAAWEWVEPVLDHWASDDHGPLPYSAGSWGPAAASALIGRSGHKWREESLPEV